MFQEKKAPILKVAGVLLGVTLLCLSYHRPSEAQEVHFKGAEVVQTDEAPPPPPPEPSTELQDAAQTRPQQETPFVAQPEPASPVPASVPSPVRSQPPDNRSLRVFLGILLTLAIITGLGVYLGLSDKAVFYESGTDVVAAFVPLVVPIALTIATAIGSYAISGDPKLNPTAFKPPLFEIWAISEALALLYVFVGAYRQNRGRVVVGLVMAVAKMCLSSLCLLMFQDLTGWNKNKSAAANWASRANAAIYLTLITALMKKLINGERVYLGTSPQPTPNQA